MAGKKGFGSVFQYSTDGGVTYLPVGNITKIKPYALKATVIDVTAMDSPSNYKEKLATLLDSGQAQIDVNFDDKSTSHKWLINNFGVLANFKVIGPGASPAIATFAGFVVGATPEYPYDKQLIASFTIEITSSVTLG